MKANVEGWPKSLMPVSAASCSIPVMFSCRSCFFWARLCHGAKAASNVATTLDTSPSRSRRYDGSSVGGVRSALVRTRHCDQAWGGTAIEMSARGVDCVVNGKTHLAVAFRGSAVVCYPMVQLRSHAVGWFYLPPLLAGAKIECVSTCSV